MKVLQLISVMLFALVTGVFWGTWFSLSRSMREITAPTFLEVGRIMIANLGGPMRVLLPGAILSVALLSYVLYRRGDATAFRLTALALALMLAAMAVTLTVNVPLDGVFVGWTLETLPSDWRTIRDRWEWYHGLRTTLSIAALTSLVGGLVVTRSERAHASPR